MKQNKYFSLRRFARLFRNDLLINQKSYLFTLVGISLAIYALSYFLMITTKHFTDSQYSASFFVYLLGMGVFIGSAFPALSNQIKTTNYLLAPGSTLEKFMVQFLIRVVIFIPLSLFIFWATQHLAKATLLPDPTIGFDPVTQIQDFHFTKLFSQMDRGQEIQMFILTLFSISTILFAGSAFFNRFALIKTIIVAALTIGMVMLSFVLFSHIFYPEVVHGFDIHYDTYVINENNLNNFTLLGYIIGGFTWLFFLPLAYFKLKEKEV